MWFVKKTVICYAKQTMQAQYHNYAPLGPHRDNLLAYQRTAHDFFMSDKLREELQKKAESTLQVLPSQSTSFESMIRH
jgi:PAB-dependent poly(A)-specific ribonuclease subunit 3